MSTNRDYSPTAEDAKLIRTSILVTKQTNDALRELADKAERPLSWEIRRALEDYVAERHTEPTEEAA